MDNLISVHKTPLSCLTPLACVGVRQSDATEQGLQQLDISAEQNGISSDLRLFWLFPIKCLLLMLLVFYCAGHGHPYASTSYGEEDLHSHNIYSDPNSMSDITDKMCLLEYVGFGWFP